MHCARDGLKCFQGAAPSANHHSDPSVCLSDEDQGTHHVLSLPLILSRRLLAARKPPAILYMRLSSREPAAGAPRAPAALEEFITHLDHFHFVFWDSQLQACCHGGGW